eukprot:scaffold92769_cov60-Phaeocystis_antarctica.AAC.2
MSFTKPGTILFCREHVGAARGGVVAAPFLFRTSRVSRSPGGLVAGLWWSAVVVFNDARPPRVVTRPTGTASIAAAVRHPQVRVARSGARQGPRAPEGPSAAEPPAAVGLLPPAQERRESGARRAARRLEGAQPEQLHPVLQPRPLRDVHAAAPDDLQPHCDRLSLVRVRVSPNPSPNPNPNPNPNPTALRQALRLGLGPGLG